MSDEKTELPQQNRLTETPDHPAEQAYDLENEPLMTLDGRAVEVMANLTSIQEIPLALQVGSQGIGLLRTEFLFTNRETEPDEEEQLHTYESIFRTLGTRPCVLRTLDAGSERELSYLGLKKENNPLLGWRSIRFSLDRPEFFKTQLRALLRCSPGRDLRILFPMVTSLEEIRHAKFLLEEARLEVAARGFAVSPSVQTGILVETPSTAILAHLFTKEVDFFMIGSRDLTQYTLAAEHGNENLAHLFDSAHPAVLHLIHHVVDAAHQAGIWVGLCGEQEGDPQTLPLLLGLGIDTFSQAPGSIPQTMDILRGWSFERAQALAEKALKMETAAEVRALAAEA